MSYEPLHHKYRPQTFADLVGQEAIATTLTNAITSGKIAPAYLLTGPRGTGKTSSARILAKSLNCLSSEHPTPIPCGKCEVCRAIARSSALDVIEMDAASNTGVDNIREIIERAQFAPVQCRYKVYVIDECLTGNSLVLTRDGLMRIDDPNIKGKMVLSYNDNTGFWEYKKVLRWLEQGIKQTLVIKTTNREIYCTSNHLIRIEQGWIHAKDVREGMKILSPANVDAAHSFTNMEPMDVSAGSSEVISFTEIRTVKNPTILPLFWNKWNLSASYVPVDAEKNWIFPFSFSKKGEALKALNFIGKDTLTKKDTDFGNVEQQTFFLKLPFCLQIASDLFTEPYWETEVSTIPIPTVDFLDYVGHTVSSSENGLNIKPVVFGTYNLNYNVRLIKDMERNQSVVEQPVILNSMRFSQLSNRSKTGNVFLWTGLDELHQKEWLGGIWTMVPSVLLKQEVHSFNFTPKDILTKKISLLLNGLQTPVISLKQCPTQEKLQTQPTITSKWEQKRPENLYQISSNIQFPQWLTSLETIESVQIAEVERVYDIEVENNHNFVANGLLVHNCHMLSTAAFNALLKTLEEPPDRVIFVLATTDPQRVLPTIISRCQRFDYRRISLEAMVTHLSKIADLENININPEAITLIAQIANGGLRDAESLLDQLSLLSGIITAEKIWELVGSVPEQDLMSLLKTIRLSVPDAVIEQCRHLLNRGKEPLVVLQNLAGFYLNLLLAKTAPQRPDMVAVTASTWQELCTEAQYWSLNDILQGQQHLKNSEVQLKNTTQPRLWLEVTLLGLLPLSSVSETLPKTTIIKQTIVDPSLIKPVEIPTRPNIKSEENKPEEKVTPVDKSSQDHSGNIWERVITEVQPNTTQTLLRQHCSLLNFNGSVAQIEVASEALLRLIRQRLASIEATFEVICQQKVKVNLQLALLSESEKLIEVTPINQLIVLPTVEHTSISQKSTDNNGTQVNSSKAESLTETLSISSFEKPLESSYLEDEITKAAESLAKCFEGEIISLDYKDDINEIISNPAKEIKSASIENSKNLSNKLIVKGRLDLDTIDDDDMPF